jgi:hypothetical protein
MTHFVETDGNCGEDKEGLEEADNEYNCAAIP